MNIASTFLCILACPFFLFSQCQEANLSAYRLDNEHRSLRLDRHGSLYTSVRGVPEFIKGDDLEDPLFSLGFSSDLWMGGFDPEGNLLINVSQYGLPMVNTFISGPLIENGSLSDEECEFFQQAWDVFGHEIALLIELQTNSSLNLNDIPENILRWPARGNPYLDGVEIENELAPFFDANADGIYDPLIGDHPIALEENPSFVPYQMTFTVYNSFSDRLSSVPMEFHQMSYLVNCNSGSASERGIFTRLKYIYKGDRPLSRFHMGLHQLPTVGCLGNDFIGCHPESQSSFSYSALSDEIFGDCRFDEIGIPDDVGVWRSIKLLNSALPYYSYFVNSGIADPDPEMASPNIKEHYYNLLDSKWLDGSPLTIGNNGFNPGSTDSTKFAFPDLPNNPNGWSIETQVNFTFPREPITGFVSGDLVPGEIGVLDFVDFVSINEEVSGLEMFDNYEMELQAIQDFYDSIINGDISCSALEFNCVNECVWPGDVDSNGIVQGRDLVLLGNILAFDPEEGIRRDVISSEWAPWSALDWDESFLGINGKYADVSGNGLISRLDVEDAWLNLGESRVSNFENVLLEETSGAIPLTIDIEIDSFELEPFLIPFFANLDLQISVGALNEQLTEPIHGLTYDIVIDTNVVNFRRDHAEALTNQFYFFEYETEGRLDSDLDVIVDTDRITVTMTNTDGQELDLGSTLSGIGLRVRQDASTSNLDSRDTLLFRFYNVFATNALGEEIILDAVTDSVIFTNLELGSMTTSTSDIYDNQLFSIYPNPTNDVINLAFDEAFTGSISVRNINGDEVLSQAITREKRLSLNLSELKAGIYILSASSYKGQYLSRKLVIY